jgi:hypothetical protein
MHVCVGNAGEKTHIARAHVLQEARSRFVCTLRSDG